MYLDTHIENDKGEKVLGQDGKFDHVVFIIGIDSTTKKYLVAHAKNSKDNFVIGTKTFDEKEIIGTLNILGG